MPPPLISQPYVAHVCRRSSQTLVPHYYDQHYTTTITLPPSGSYPWLPFCEHSFFCFCLFPLKAAAATELCRGKFAKRGKSSLIPTNNANNNNERGKARWKRARKTPNPGQKHFPRKVSCVSGDTRKTWFEENRSVAFKRPTHTHTNTHTCWATRERFAISVVRF